MGHHSHANNTCLNLRPSWVIMADGSEKTENSKKELNRPDRLKTDSTDVMTTEKSVIT